VLVEYKSVHELVDVWCKWAEMHLARKDYHKALEILGRATAVPTLTANISYRDDTLPPQKRLFKSLKLWSFYADLEESVGNMTSAKAVYDQMLSLKIANPQTILNYATFLEEQHYFEESFKVYQRGIDTFGYPIAFEIWNVYLPKFAARYGATKLERTRDLFEQALVQCPPKNAFALYVMYGKMEEQYGLMRNAMGIYERGTQAVDRDTRLSMYRYYINKAAQVYGLVSTRPIYQSALDVLPDSDAKDLCMEFAEMECKLGEIDRARALYAYASQFCDPTTVQDFWTLWNDFEVKHGNEDTFKEMLRIKRSVQAQYSTQIKFISAQILAQDQA
jgi:pre-mRNA-splicing factor SYF1